MSKTTLPLVSINPEEDEFARYVTDFIIGAQTYGIRQVGRAHVVRADDEVTMIIRYSTRLPNDAVAILIVQTLVQKDFGVEQCVLLRVSQGRVLDLDKIGHIFDKEIRGRVCSGEFLQKMLKGYYHILTGLLRDAMRVSAFH